MHDIALFTQSFWGPRGPQTPRLKTVIICLTKIKGLATALKWNQVPFSTLNTEPARKWQ